MRKYGTDTIVLMLSALATKYDCYECNVIESNRIEYSAFK